MNEGRGKIVEKVLKRAIQEASIKELMFGEHNFYKNLACKIFMVLREVNNE